MDDILKHFFMQHGITMILKIKYQNNLCKGKTKYYV